MTDTLSSIHDMLERHEVEHIVHSDDTIYLAHSSGSLRLHVTITGTPHLLRIMAYVPGHILAKRRKAVAELLARINVRVTYGSFQMFMDKNTVFFEVSMPLLADLQTPEQTERLFSTALERATSHVDYAWDLILRVGRIPISPQHAMRILNERIEAGKRQRRVPKALLETDNINMN
jgi:hypothetical protein